MDRSAEIMAYMSSPDAVRMMILAPNAPPVGRGSTEISVPIQVVLDAVDVTDTLRGLRGHASGDRYGDFDFDETGTFSFGLPDVGRIRVNYVTQRGSKVISLHKVPFTVPAASELCDDSDALDALRKLVAGDTAGFLTVYGPNAHTNSVFVYSLLQHANTTARKVIYVLERALTFLMRHDNSIVIQTELNSDVHSIEEGVQNAFLFEPDILYIGDVRRTDEIPSVRHAVKGGVFAILASVGADGEMLLEKLQPLRTSFDDGSQELAVVNVRVLPVAGNKMTVKIVD